MSIPQSLVLLHQIDQRLRSLHDRQQDARRTALGHKDAADATAASGDREAEVEHRQRERLAESAMASVDIENAGQASQLMAERRNVVRCLPTPLYMLYSRLLDECDGQALALLTEPRQADRHRYACQACRQTLPAGDVDRRFSQATPTQPPQCPSCRRILYRQSAPPSPNAALDCGERQHHHRSR